MCAQHRHSRSRSSKGHRQHGKHRGATIISPERYARKLARRVKVLAEQNSRAGIYVPFDQVASAADQWMRTGEPVRFVKNNDVNYEGGIPAGSNGNKPIATGRGTVAAPYLETIAPDRGVPETVEVNESLLKLSGRLQRLQDSLDRKRLRMKQGGFFTLEAVRELEELERTVKELQAEIKTESIVESASPEAEERSKEIIQYATRNGLTWQQASERLYPQVGPRRRGHAEEPSNWY